MADEVSIRPRLTGWPGGTGKSSLARVPAPAGSASSVAAAASGALVTSGAGATRRRLAGGGAYASRRVRPVRRPWFGTSPCVRSPARPVTSTAVRRRLPDTPLPAPPGSFAAARRRVLGFFPRLFFGTSTTVPGRTSPSSVGSPARPVTSTAVLGRLPNTDVPPPATRMGGGDDTWAWPGLG